MSRRAVLGLAAAAAVSIGFARRGSAAVPSLHISYFDDFAPFSFQREDGSLTGILVDALDEILGRRCGIALTTSAAPWPQAQQAVKDGNADAFCTLKSDLRLTYADFSTQVLVSPEVMVVFAKNNPRAEAIRAITAPAELNAFSVTTYKGDSRIDTLFKGMDVNVVPDVEHMLRAIAAGDSDLTVVPSFTWKYHARGLGLRDALDESVFLSASEFRLGIRRSHPSASAILAQFDEAVVAARDDGTLERIIAAYG